MTLYASGPRPLIDNAHRGPLLSESLNLDEGEHSTPGRGPRVEVVATDVGRERPSCFVHPCSSEHVDDQALERGSVEPNRPFIHPDTAISGKAPIGVLSGVWGTMGGERMSEGQSGHKVCVCGRPTYGAPGCRRCAAIDRAQHVDRMTVWPETLCTADTDEIVPPQPNTPPATTPPPSSKRTGTVRAVEQPDGAKTTPQQKIAAMRKMTKPTGDK